MIAEPGNLGAVVEANLVGSKTARIKFTRYSATALRGFEPWVGEDGVTYQWAELVNPTHVSSPYADDFAAISFQMGLATGTLIDNGEKAMPLDMLFRLMSGEKWEDLQ